jgi:hypothetical protein
MTMRRMDYVGVVVGDLEAAMALPALLRPRPRGDHRRAGRAAQLTARRADLRSIRTIRWTDQDNDSERER